jgi:hypothetical protein
VVEVPAGATAGGFLDIWQWPISDTGQTGPDRGGGGKYLIVPPGSDIQQMRGYILARSPSNQVWFAARALDRDPKAAKMSPANTRSMAGTSAITRPRSSSTQRKRVRANWWPPDAP